MYEYKIIPAPVQAAKFKGAKSIEARFARTVEEEVNRAAADGWEYVRADTLPCQERSGLTSKTTKFHTMLVFRRATAKVVAVETPPARNDEAVPPATPTETPQPENPTVLNVLRTMKGTQDAPSQDEQERSAP